MFKLSDDSTNDLHTRQYRLILYTTCELIGLCLIIISLYTISHMWYMIALVSTAAIVSSLNLWLLIHTKNTNLCGHIITAITLTTVIIANYLVGGMGTPYSIWFYVIPLLAASLLGEKSLLMYSTLSLLMIIGFGTLHIQPYYHLLPYQAEVIQWTNHLVAFLVIVTTLNSLMRENKLYEKILNDKNYLLQAEKDKFKYLARFDQLTNLPNRQYFLQHLQGTIDALATHYCVTVFFMDLDNLKYINDHFGHVAGDHLLRQTARRLCLCFREGDFIARLGGDEFTAIVLHSQDETIPNEIAKRIIYEFNKPIVFENIEYASSISIGLATYPLEAKTVAELMIKADAAMYTAKKRNLTKEIAHSE